MNNLFGALIDTRQPKREETATPEGNRERA